MRRLAPAAGALLLFVVLAGALLEFRPGYADTRLPGGLGDPVLVLYFLEWGGESIGDGLRDFWDAGFYFPAAGVMTMADHMLGPAVQAKAFRLLWDDGLAAYNFLFLGSFVLSGLTTAWVLRQGGASRSASLLGGIMFAFAPYRFDQQSHLPVLLAQWLPLVLWHWDRLLNRPGWRQGLLFGAFYLLHTTGGNYLAYFIHFALAILLLQHRRRWRELVSPGSLRRLLPVVAICGAVALALYYPYVRAQDELGLTRSEDEIQFYGATLGSWLSIDTGNELWGRLLRRFGRPENHLFAGFVTTGFAIAGAAWLSRSPRRRSLTTWERGVLWSGAFFVVLSFPWAFLALGRVVPGLDGMRVPTRVYPFVSLALVLLAARGIDALLASARTGNRRTVAAALIGLMLVVELRGELRWRRFPPPRGVERAILHEIGRRPEVRAVLHLPILADARESLYMHSSTVHWKPIANGYSGFAPATYLELKRRVREHLLDEATIDHLLGLGITHVATHPPLLQTPRGRRHLAAWERRFSRGPEPRLRLVLTAGDDRLYELQR
jgi:hypothetical protein